MKAVIGLAVVVLVAVVPMGCTSVNNQTASGSNPRQTTFILAEETDRGLSAVHQSKVQDTPERTMPGPKAFEAAKVAVRDSHLQHKNVTWTVFGAIGTHSRLDSVPKNRTIVDYDFKVHQGLNFTTIKNVTQELKAQNVVKTSCILEGSRPSDNNQMAPYIQISITYQ